jgi:hypothetical protein
MGATGVRRVNSVVGRKGFPGGPKPRNRDAAEPAPASVVGVLAAGNGKWVHPRGNVAETSREEKASKG